MTDDRKQVAESLLKAIKAERYGHDFYMMAANSTQDPKGREVFQQLAQEELDHMRFLKKHYDSVLATGKPDSNAKLGAQRDLSDMWPIFSESLKERVKDAHFEMTSLSVGIQLEHDAIQFYKDQAEASGDPELARFFGDLADWEAGHYAALLRQQEALKESYWSANGFTPF